MPPLPPFYVGAGKDIKPDCETCTQMMKGTFQSLLDEQQRRYIESVSSAVELAMLKHKEHEVHISKPERESLTSLIYQAKNADKLWARTPVFLTAITVCGTLFNILYGVLHK